MWDLPTDTSTFLMLRRAVSRGLGRRRTGLRCAEPWKNVQNLFTPTHCLQLTYIFERDAVNCLVQVNESLLATGDDDGCLKVITFLACRERQPMALFVINWLLIRLTVNTGQKRPFIANDRLLRKMLAYIISSGENARTYHYLCGKFSHISLALGRETSSGCI